MSIPVVLVTPHAAVFVTPHAAAAFAARVRSGARDPAKEIVLALRRPIFRLARPGLTLWGCLTAEGDPYLIATDPAGESAPFLLVRTVGPWWFWHEARPLWKQAGVIRKQGARGKWSVIPPQNRLLPERKSSCP